MIRVLLAATLLMVPCLVSAKGPIRTLDACTVVKVADGDTLTANCEGAKVKVRLYGIDAPETEKGKPGQPYGEEAYRALQSKVMGKQIKLEVIDVDRYKRAVSVVWVGDREINREMVTEGWAWAYRQYLDRAHASEYLGAEEEARRAGRGLWTQSNPQPPWEFRREMRVR